MKILEAVLRWKDSDPSKPNLTMRGDKHWLLTFAAMIIRTMELESGFTRDELFRLLRAEMIHLDVEIYKDA